MKAIREYPIVGTGEARWEQKTLFKLGKGDEEYVELYDTDLRAFDNLVRYDLGMCDVPAPFDGTRYTHYYIYLTKSRRYLTVVEVHGLSI